MSAEVRNENNKHSKSPRQFFRGVIENLSPKISSTKHHLTLMDDSGKIVDSPKAPINSPVVQTNSPLHHKTGGGYFNPSLPTVQQTSAANPKATANGNGVHLVNQDQALIDRKVVNSPADKPLTHLHESPNNPPECTQPKTVKDLPPHPPLEEGPAAHPTYTPLHHDAERQKNLEQILDDQDKVIDDLKLEREALLQALDDQQEQHLLKAQELKQEVAKWKTRVIDAASKNADVPAHAPLSRPESQLIKDWQNLTFDVRNLVANHFSGGENRVVAWAKARSECLREITPVPVDVASNRKSSSALVEAAVWSGLLRSVFGETTSAQPMCWAGRYKGRLNRLTTKVQRDLPQTEPGQYDALYHQWKALTTSIVSVVQVPQDRDEEVEIILEELEDLLPPFRSRISSSGPYRRELQAVINKAIDLDLKLSGQQVYYGVRWPLHKRYHVPFDDGLMKPATGSSQPPQNVRFMVQPCLVRAGGTRGEDFNKHIVIDQCTVWM